MLLAGWEPRATALDKEVSSPADVGHVKFVGSHLETLGLVVWRQEVQTNPLIPLTSSSAMIYLSWATERTSLLQLESQFPNRHSV